MGVFDDKKFESLDWISQATEPIDSELNEILGALPDELVVDFKTYRAIIGESWMADFSVNRAINYMIASVGTKPLTWEQRNTLDQCFEIEIDNDVILDFTTQTITGSIKLFKTKCTLDEKVLENLLGKGGVAAFGQAFFPRDASSRANDIVEILGGCDDALRTRSLSRKKSSIHKRLIKLFKDNEWKIKDTELANKVGHWIKDYICDGNLAAYSNFCKLKVMTHKDQPIYSMQETE